MKTINRELNGVTIMCNGVMQDYVNGASCFWLVRAKDVKGTFLQTAWRLTDEQAKMTFVLDSQEGVGYAKISINEDEYNALLGNPMGQIGTNFAVYFIRQEEKANLDELTPEFHAQLEEWGFDTLQRKQQALDILENPRNGFPVRKVSQALKTKNFGLNWVNTKDLQGKLVDGIRLIDPYRIVLHEDEFEKMEYTFPMSSRVRQLSDI